MKNEIRIVTPQFDRNWELDFTFIPKNDDEFRDFVKECPTERLKGFGFGLWGSYNEQIEENQLKPVHNIIKLPAIDLTGEGKETFEFDAGRKDAPITTLKEDKDIYLLPAEWYNSIPDGFELVDICGKKEFFKNGKTDNDQRFGCLAYGILRKHINQVE